MAAILRQFSPRPFEKIYSYKGEIHLKALMTNFPYRQRCKIHLMNASNKVPLNVKAKSTHKRPNVVKYMCLTSLTRAKPKEKMEFPA